MDATPGDRFSTYLSVLTACLEDPDASGADLARRAYLSRYHFDRMAAAALGEPPGAFRRRLLLERAAHALVVTGVRILDVAVAAGYGSQQAFTRAFERAYGVTPRTWRVDAGTRAARDGVREFELPAPSGVHFQPPQGIRIPESRKVTEMDLLQTMVDHHVDVVGALAERLDDVPDVELDRELTMEIEWVDATPLTLRRMASDLVRQEERYLYAVQGRDLPAEPDDSVAGIRARHAAAGPAYRAFVANVLARDGLGDTFVMAECDPPQTRTFGGAIMHVLTFGAVRRTMTLRAYAAATGDDSLGWGDPAHLLDPIA